ncbi:MAG TPA: serine hydrolase [Gemmatimonadaceae bacterium]|jgi:Beta-lactamase class C and other penicillin binding proteins
MLQIVSTACIVVSGICAPSPAAPPIVGLSPARLSTIDHVARLGIDARGYAGMAVVVGRHGTIAWQRGYGSLTWGTGTPRVSVERTMYDLASLTKVVATTAAVMVLYDEGKLRLDDRASRYLPELRTGARSTITIRQLLEHTSGLPAGRDLWRDARGPREARRLVLSSPLVRQPGERQVYSDLGADVLGFVVEAVSGQPLDVFVERHIFRPLGMKSTMFRPSRALRSRIAPTERFAPRGRSLRGEVHDENAWALGGVAGHAGLFATASDLAIFAQMMLDGGIHNGARIVRDSTIALFTTRVAGTRALGWDTCAGGASCGQHMSERAYGHTGFTGTSLWIDPDRDMFVIVLTNRIHELPDGSTPRGAILADVRADIADIAELSVVDGGLAAEMPSRLRADRAIGWGVGSPLPASAPGGR